MTPPKRISDLRLRDATRTVWIFGAGASVPYGVPNQAGILEYFLTAPLKGLKGIAEIEARRTRIESVCCHIYPGWKPSDSRIALEELFAANELARDDPRSTSKEASEASSTLRDLLLAMRFAVVTRGNVTDARWLPFARSGKSSPYAELLEKVFPAGTTSSDAHLFVTLNYDINFDRCVINMRDSKSNLDIDYGVLFANARHQANPDVPTFQEPREGAILVLRPHGGLTWFRCLACRSVFTTLGRRQQIPKGNVCWACKARRVDYVLVHPSYSRRYDDPLLSVIWGRMYEELVKSDRWVFIGYSLPSADYHFRALLRDVLAVRDGNSQPTKIVHVGIKDNAKPDSVKAFNSVVDTYQAMFHDRLLVWDATKKGFSDFAAKAIVP